MAYIATDAAAYELSMGRWSRRLADRFLDACALPAGARVLDAGCGTGALSAALALRDPAAAITGIDLSAAYVAAAQARVPAGRFLTADITRIPASDAAFDAALSMLVLAFVPDRAAAARELRRVTRPGGLVAVAMWDFWGGLPFLRLFADSAAAVLPKAATWRDGYLGDAVGTPGVLGGLLADAGLAEVAEQDLLIRMEFAGFEDWFGAWRSGQGVIGSFIAGLTEPERALVEPAVRAAWCTGSADGPHSFAAVARLALGRVPG